MPHRIIDSEDRDCCAYIKDEPPHFECGHYFSRVGLHGSCYSGGDFQPYDNIETVLSREEYQELIDFAQAISDLGYGIKEGDERYQRGIDLCNSIQHIYSKLRSEIAEEFFRKIQESEREFVMDEYGLSEEQVSDIFDHYYQDYRDRSIVGAIYKDTYDCGYEEAWSLGYVNNNDSIVERYFDFQRFGEDLLSEEHYHELDDGRVVYLMY